MKQGVQLILERVQRHRAFPRLAAANGQNLQATLSPTNVSAPRVLRLEQPRFVPVIAEPLTLNVSRLENTVSQLEPRNEINAVDENTSLEVAFQTVANDATRVDEQFAAQISQQIFDQTLALETSGRFEGTEIVEPKTLSENLASEMPSERVPTPNDHLPRIGQQTEISNDRSTNLSTARQATGVETRASQTNQGVNQSPPAGTAQPITSQPITSQPPETLPPVANSRQDALRVDTVQAKISTPPLSLNLEQDISFSEPNQNEDTELTAREISGSLVNPFLETPNLSPKSTPTVNASQDSQLESSTPIETAAPPVRSPSRLESTLEALRQFNPPTQNDESTVGLGSAQPNSRATKTSNVLPSEAASKIQLSSQKTLEPNLAKPQVQIENQNAPEPKAIAGAKPEALNNQNPSTVQAMLEAQAVTRVNPVLPTETADTREDGIEVVTEDIKTQNAGIEAVQVQLDSLASESSGLEKQMNVSDPQQNETATLQTHFTQTSQSEIPLVVAAQAKLPQVNPAKPELNRETSSFETPSEQRPNEDTQRDRQTLIEQSGLVASPTTQTPLSEEARERAAYQRSVLMRAERAKRALAAKEELERDPTLELEINETPATRSSEAPQAAAPNLTPPLEAQPQTKVMPSVEAGLENLKPQNPETSRSSQNMTPDLDVAVQSNLNHQFANNVELAKPIVNSSTTEPLKDSSTTEPLSDSSTTEPLSDSLRTNLSELQASNSRGLQATGSNEIQPIDSSEIQTPNSSETQTLDLNPSMIENGVEIQPNQSPNQIQNSNFTENPSQVATPNSSQAATTPHQDLPTSFLTKTEGVSVYNPQRRIQRAAPTPPAKPKHEPNEAEKLFDQTPGMSQQDVINVIRKAQGLPPVPTTSQVQNPAQENIPTAQTPAQNAQATNNLGQETLQPTAQAVESDNQSLIATALSQTNQDTRVELAQEDFNTSNSSLNELQTTDTTPSQTRAIPTKDASVTANTLDANGNKIHVFNPPNRRTLPPKPKVEQPKTEAQKLFDAMDVTETADELFQRVVKNKLKPNADLEPQERVQGSSLDFENTTPSLETTSSSNQTLLPNLPNRNLLNSNDQQPSASFTGNERLQPSGSERVQPSGSERVQLSGSERVQLSQNATRFLKPIVGIDPNDVKIYRDPQTERLTKAARADALTIGDTVLLSSEQPLESPETLGLIAHELTHVARNRQARFVPPVARGNSSLAASAQSGNEEGLALGVEAFARQGWNNFNQNTPTQNPRSQTTSSNTVTNRSSAGGLPAPADLPTWFIEDRMPPQTASQPAPRASNVARSAPSESPFVSQPPTNPMAASMGAQAASQGRDVPTPPPAAGPLPASQPAKPEPTSNRAAPDLDAMARQVYTILKRRLANERHRM